MIYKFALEQTWVNKSRAICTAFILHASHQSIAPKIDNQYYNFKSGTVNIPRMMSNYPHFSSQKPSKVI